MIDWHCHILPEIDDGAKTMEESLAMGRLLVEKGFHTVHCTPHCIHGGYDNTPEGVQRAVEELQRELIRAKIPLTVVPGMEYYLDEYFPKQLGNLQPLGNSRLVLVEAPTQASADLIRENIFQLTRKGYIPLFAHPERCTLLHKEERQREQGVLQKRFKRFYDKLFKSRPFDGPLYCDNLRHVLREMGCLFQGNISSFAGWYGREVRQQALQNLSGGFYSRVGSDGHGFGSLEKTLGKGLAVIEGCSEGVGLLGRSVPVLQPIQQGQLKNQLIAHG